MTWKWIVAAVVLLTGCTSVPAPEPVALAESGTVEIGGAAIRYQSAELSADAPLTFLFLHGAAYTSQTWVDNGILVASADGDAQSIAIDLPGFGESDTPSLSDEEFVPEVLRSLGLAPETTIIISPSMSGMFSLPALRRGSLDGLAGFVGVAPVGAGGFATSVSAPLEIPMRAVWGDSDGADPQAAASALAAGFSEAQTVVISSAGHAAYNDQPEVFTDLLREFANTLAVCADRC